MGTTPAMTPRMGPSSESAARVRDAYREMAARYIELFGTTAAVPPDDLALIVRHLSARHGAVLDVGCGPGHLTAHLRSLQVDATGIDLVPEFIEHARAAHPDGRFVLASIDRLPVCGQSIAGIVSWYSLIHVPPNGIDAVLTELRRAMASGGALVVGFFDGDEIDAFEHKVVTAYRWPADQLSARLRQAGFREIERRRRPAVAAAGTRAQGLLAAVAD